MRMVREALGNQLQSACRAASPERGTDSRRAITPDVPRRLVMDPVSSQRRGVTPPSQRARYDDWHLSQHYFSRE